jgi:adenylosuccinate synthase
MSPDDYAFGWTDINLLRHAELINKLSCMMLTHLDALDGVETIKLAKHYTLKNEKGEDIIIDCNIPADIEDWEAMEPEYI